MIDKLYLVDALNLLFRAYYAIRPMANPKGEPTNALFGFIRSIHKLIKDFAPQYLVICFDGPDNKIARQEIYADYKSHRKGMPEDLVPQLERALQFCKLANLPYLCPPNVEADDTMGSIAKWAEAAGSCAYICTSDKDLCQLVSDRIFVVNLHKDNLLIDRKGVEETWGVAPEQMVDLLALTGDASDHIPGLEGIGPKTAVQLLQQFGTLEQLLAHPERVKGKKGEVVAKGRDIALLSKRLATIDLNVPFPKEEAFFRLRPPDSAGIQAFYHEMRFLSLLKELDEAMPASDGWGAATYHLVDEERKLQSVLAKVVKSKEVCIDTEATSLEPMRARLVGIGLCMKEAEGWYLPMNGKLGRVRVLRALEELARSSEIAWIGHNIKYDLHVLLNEGIALQHVGFDTMLASYLLHPERQRHNLDELTLDLFGKIKIPIEQLLGSGKKQIGMEQVAIDQVCSYCCEDVDATLRLKRRLEGQLQQAGLMPLFVQMELPLIAVLLRMERRGIYVDLSELATMSREIGEKIGDLQKQIHEMAGCTFNVSSPKQLSRILFEKMGIKPPKRTQTGYSTSAETLEALQEEVPIVKKIMEYRFFEKLRSTYTDALPGQVLASTQRIHCTFNQSVAATGRLSCQDPNLQNIPVRVREGRRIREAFKPQLAGWRFVSADYSQIELRLLAHLCEDPVLVKAFVEGQDVHTYTASLVFNVPLAEVTHQMRDQAKVVNFGILYGQQAFGLSQQLGIGYAQAERFIETYFQRYRGVKEYLDACKQSARTTGRAVTMTGRQRPIPEIHNTNAALRAQAERLAINTPLQGSAADLIKMAMIEVDRTLQEHPQWGYMVLQIHDELLFEVPEAQVEPLASCVKQIMEGVMPLKVPLVVDISVGKNWGECYD